MGLDLGRKRLSHKDLLFKVLVGDFFARSPLPRDPGHRPPTTDHRPPTVQMAGLTPALDIVWPTPGGPAGGPGRGLV